QTETRDALGFPRTIWSDLRVAGAAEDEIRLQALESLLRKYLPALKAYLRASLKRKFGLGEEWVEDCASAFVLEKILNKELIAKADQKRGRFRDLLKKSLHNFGIKPGGGPGALRATHRTAEHRRSAHGICQDGCLAMD